MKKNIIFNLFILIVAGITSNCGNGAGNRSADSSLQKSDTGKAIITFMEYEHNFGKVEEGEKVACIFTFQNTGTARLAIAMATTSCGCTVPRYETKPVLPGGKGNIEVVFDTSGRSGIQSKTISVKSNATTPLVLLKITAEILTNK